MNARCAILQDDMDMVKLEKDTNRRPEVGHPSSEEPGKDTSERKKPGRGVWRDGRRSKSPDTKPQAERKRSMALESKLLDKMMPGGNTLPPPRLVVAKRGVKWQWI